MEQQGEYTTTQEIEEGLAMFGKGYDEQQEIHDESDLRKYRIELPNLYDDAGLDPFEFRLLAHYKRVGTCTEGTPTTATKCRISTGQVSQKRQSLHDKGFIIMQKVYLDEEKKTYSYRITVVDKWRENFERYYDPSRGEPPHSRREAPPSPHELKNTDDDAALSKIAKAYESEIGVITSMIADDLQDASKSYPLEWILDAIHEAAVQNKRGWKYCLAILRRWQAQGNQETAKKPAANPAPSSIPDMDDFDKMYGFGSA
jgi:DnaD/phage-associated family protein